jgi:hypothetical protein
MIVWTRTIERARTFQLPVQEEAVSHAQTYEIIENDMKRVIETRWTPSGLKLAELGNS